MKTLTVTAARQNLGAWLKKAVAGEDIGVMIDGEIVAFRRVKVYSQDYPEHQYGATPDKLEESPKAPPRDLKTYRKGRRGVATTASAAPLRKPMPDIAARLKKVFGDKIISAEDMKKLWDYSRGDH